MLSTFEALAQPEKTFTTKDAKSTKEQGFPGAFTRPLQQLAIFGTEYRPCDMS
jgi:hypothetical protein